MRSLATPAPGLLPRPQPGRPAHGVCWEGWKLSASPGPFPPGGRQQGNFSLVRWFVSTTPGWLISPSVYFFDKYSIRSILLTLTAAAG